MKALQSSETSGTVYHLTLRNTAGDTNLQTAVLSRMISKRALVTGMYTRFTAGEMLANTILGGDKFQILVPGGEN